MPDGRVYPVLFRTEEEKTEKSGNLWRKSDRSFRFFITAEKLH